MPPKKLSNFLIKRKCVKGEWVSRLRATSISRLTKAALKRSPDLSQATRAVDADRIQETHRKFVLETARRAGAEVSRTGDYSRALSIFKKAGLLPDTKRRKRARIKKK